MLLSRTEKAIRKKSLHSQRVADMASIGHDKSAISPDKILSKTRSNTEAKVVQAIKLLIVNTKSHFFRGKAWNKHRLDALKKVKK